MFVLASVFLGMTLVLLAGVFVPRLQSKWAILGVLFFPFLVVPITTILYVQFPAGDQGKLMYLFGIFFHLGGIIGLLVSPPGS